VTERHTPVSVTLKAEDVIGLVARALLVEVQLTPKPGLVDIRNSGAHRDMDLATLSAARRRLHHGWKSFYHGS
jgi:triphosphoribosyl-dephospho-CoA synthase